MGLVLVLGLGLPLARAWPAFATTLFGSSTAVHDDQLALSIEIPNRSFRADEPIPITATLTYIGQADVVTLSSEYRDAVYFDLEQLDGPLDMDGAASRLICYDSALRRGVGASIPFTKAGGYVPTASDGAFWAGYFSEPHLLRLPAGSWRVSAHLSAAIGTDCVHADHELATAVSFNVDP